MSDNVPSDLRYTGEHEWARQQGRVVVVGVTSQGQQMLGDVVSLELPRVGSAVTAGRQVGVIESAKVVSELFAPVSGKVVKVNEALKDNPLSINTDPYGAGWIIEIELEDAQPLTGLLDAVAYAELLKNS